MSEEFQGGVCGGSWWPVNSTTNLFRSSPCSSAINDPSGSFGWLNHDQPSCIVNTRSKSDDDSASSAASDASIVLQHVQNPSDENLSSSIFTSALQTMGINDDDWNQNLLHDGDNIGRSEQNYCNQILQATSQLDLINSSIMNNNYGQNSYGSSYNSSPSLLQTLFDPDSHNVADHQYLLDNNNRSTIYHHQPSPNFMDSTDFRPKLINSNNNLHFNNNHTPFWNAPASNFLPSSQPQLALPSPPNTVKPKLHSLTTKQRNQESSRGLNSAAAKKVKHEPPPVKRTRIETPSPLPAFKVRKEKLGDRVTALQQLVSPFGKTDTASVLHEAIEYIKFLHDQVLSTPYMKKNGTPQLQNYQQGGEKKKDDEIQDLISRGLCLVPISSTFPVAAETTTDFWTPTFGGCFR